MIYYKNLDGDYIFAVSIDHGKIPIDETEHNAIVSAVASAPTAPSGYTYKLRAADLQWELVELSSEPEPELDTEEALNILLGGAI